MDLRTKQSKDNNRRNNETGSELKKGAATGVLTVIFILFKHGPVSIFVAGVVVGCARPCTGTVAHTDRCWQGRINDSPSSSSPTWTPSPSTWSHRTQQMKRK